MIYELVSMLMVWANLSVANVGILNQIMQISNVNGLCVHVWNSKLSKKVKKKLNQKQIGN